MNRKDIVDAWTLIRKENNTIPDHVLDFMKESALETLNKVSYPTTTVEKLVKKHTDRLNTMKENRAEAVDRSSSAENECFDQLIQFVAEFIRDLKSVPVPYVNPIPRGHYNEAPEGLIEISLEDWKTGMFHYKLEQSDSKQVRTNGQVFDLRLFDVPNFDNKKLGFAVMDDWFDSETGRNRPQPIVRFCRYGKEEDWKSFRSRFAAQFAGDNS